MFMTPIKILYNKQYITVLNTVKKNVIFLF